MHVYVVHLDDTDSWHIGSLHGGVESLGILAIYMQGVESLTYVGWHRQVVLPSRAVAM